MEAGSVITSYSIHYTKLYDDALLFVGAKKFFGIRDADNFKYVDRAHCENSKYIMAKQGPFLFNLNHDTNESYDVSNKFPERRETLSKKLAEMQEFADKNPRA